MGVKMALFSFFFLPKKIALCSEMAEAPFSPVNCHSTKDFGISCGHKGSQMKCRDSWLQFLQTLTYCEKAGSL